MVNQERIALACDALVALHEDGTPVYPKGVGVLHRIKSAGVIPGDTWCCLGVFSNEAEKQGLIVTRRVNSAGHEVFGEGSDASEEVLCTEVMDWYGFEDDNPPLLILDEKIKIAAAEWNDCGIGTSNEPPQDFTEIAEAFRRTFITENKS